MSIPTSDSRPLQLVADYRRQEKELRDLLRDVTAERDEAVALLRMVRDEPSLNRVKNVMGHDLIHGCIAVFLGEWHRETGPNYHEVKHARESTP